MYPLYHPLRNFKIGENYPVITEAKGITLKDINGNEYIDLISGLWNLPLGYSNEAIKEAIKEQTDKLPYINLFNLSNDTNIKLAKKLCSLSNDFYSKVLYTCTGSESVEVAIKIIHKYQNILKNNKRKYIGVFDISYHGTYYGSMSASGIDKEFIEDGYGEVLNNFIRLDAPMCMCCKSESLSKECLDNMINNMRNVFINKGDELAAIIIEPVIGSGGMIEVPKEYIKALKEECDKNEVLLVFDEVATGFCRAGNMFAYENYNIKPDILLLSKGINNGYLPFGATLINEKVNRVLSKEDNVLIHLSTQNGNPICCASALATIEELEKNNYKNIVKKKGEKFKSDLRERLEKYPAVYEIRQTGLMIAIDLSSNKEKRVKLDYQKIDRLVESLLKKGVIVYSYCTEKNSGITLMPSFITSDEEWEKCIRKIENAIKRIGI